jgi:hypothetical protein
MIHRASSSIQLVLLAVAASFLSGCGTNDEWMPMKVHRRWTYRVRAGFERHTVPITVSREITVASTTGFELASPLGVSRLAWKSGHLVAESMVNARFIPPIPLLVPDLNLDKTHLKSMKPWHGRIDVSGIERPAEATLEEQNDTVDLGTRKVPTILTILTVTLPAVEPPNPLPPASGLFSKSSGPIRTASFS